MSDSSNHDWLPSELELAPERMRELGYRVVDLLVDRYAGLRAERAWRGATRAELDARLGEAAPESPTPFETVLGRLVDDVLPYRAHVDHPRFFAFVPGAPTWPGVLGDLIASGANIFQGTWLSSAGVSALELTVLDWFCRWVGFPEGAGGLFLSGGSAANLTALACARASRYGAHRSDLVVYCSAETHSSAPRAARVLGFADERIRTVAVDDEDRVRVDALASMVVADRAAGLEPFLLVANAGTTSTGAVDPLDALAELCARERLWLHVDAAYGGFAVLTERGRAELAGMARADSLALDPHKWLYQPFETGCLLVRDVLLLERAFHVMPPYLQDTALPTAGGGSGGTERLPVNFANRGIQLTRTARVLKVWLSVQTFGLGAFRAAIDSTLDLARYAESRIRRSATLELLTPARLGIVCFRRRPTDETQSCDELNAALLHALLAAGIAMISSTRVGGAFALRLCVLNYRTRRGDIDDVIDWLESTTSPLPESGSSGGTARSSARTPCD
jgi:glutamate/tyrosine decarboxylase-like PLP-dependent enzyme